MKAFHLKIVTPDGLLFDGDAYSLTVRTVAGDVGILADHMDLVTALGMGRATVVTESGPRYAACIGGMLSVTRELVSLVATTFEWAENIDVSRARASYDRADRILHDKDASQMDLRLAEARLKRSLVRQSVARGK
ncbi:MAG: ATP synthase F1 subunit epsilon [Faecousia sp.]